MMKTNYLSTCTDYLYSFSNIRIINIIMTKVKEATMETRLNIFLLQPAPPKEKNAKILRIFFFGILSLQNMMAMISVLVVIIFII